MLCNVRAYLDKGVGTFLDGYTDAEFALIANYFFESNSIEGLRNRFDHLTGDAMMVRGNEKRELRLSDLCFCTISDVNFGPTAARVLVMMLHQDKTNKVIYLAFSQLRMAARTMLPAFGIWMKICVQ
jgi:hypothetical protein